MAGIVITIILLTLVVLTVAGIWMTFTKAGEGGWKALIPIYNNYIMLRIGGHSGWWVLTFLLPVIPWLIGVSASIANAQSFGTGTESTGDFTSSAQMNFGLEQLFQVGGVLTFLFVVLVMLVVGAFFHLVMLVTVVMTYDVARSFGKGMGFTFGLLALPFVFWPILGFGDAEYRGPAAHPNMVEQGSGAHIDKDRF